MYHSVTASAPGRVCFAGEDIDWISGPAILGAINLRLKVTVTSLPKDCDYILLKSDNPFNVQRRVPLLSVGQYKRHVMDYVEAAVKVLIKRGIKITPIEIGVSSNLPARAGLSSSAAVSIASISALAKFYGIPLSNHEICDLAYSVESDELNTGAGQMDFYACGLGGFMYINSASRPPSPIEQLNLPSGLGVIVADTMVPRNTADIIRSKRERLERAEPSILSYVKYTEAAIKQIHRILREPDPDLERFGTLITSCHMYLDKYMRVSTDMLNKCVDTCLLNGAVGAKLTGTGMGGCMFAVAPTAAVTRIQESLLTHPVLTYATDISTLGVVVERVDNL